MPILAARSDFGHADGYIAGKQVRVNYFCVYPPHADGCVVKAYPAAPAEASCKYQVAAFDFSGDDSITGRMRLC